MIYAVDRFLPHEHLVKGYEGPKGLDPVLIDVLSGLAEMVMVVLGAVFFTTFAWTLPYGLGLAGGAMLYVTVKGMIPEIYRGRRVKPSSL